jgi:hypothetical protein
MDKVDEYRRYATYLFELATRAKSDDKRRLLVMSQAWLYLADKLSRLAGRQKTTERLVREVRENRPNAE